MVAAWPVGGTAQNDATPNDPDAMARLRQTAQAFSKEIVKRIQLDYLLYLPKDYRAGSTKRWPLVLFLHGAGERGTNLAKVAVHGPPKLVKQGEDFPFVLVSPQCPNGQHWNTEALLALLDDLVARHSVDTNRLYVTGLSMGGYGTWALAIAAPERFAAVAPICGGGDPIGILLAGAQKKRALKTLGVWAFHGAKDPVVPLAESEKMVKAFKDVGCADVQFTVYPDAGHDSWTESYANPKLFDWLLSHRR
jgi:predicted peptidase